VLSKAAAWFFSPWEGKSRSAARFLHPLAEESPEN
jgi:hypothetical protein